jgi:hypothetical protein
MRRPIAPIALFLALAPALLVGCGSGNTVRVTGKLFKGGSPYQPPEGQNVTLAFYEIESQDASGKLVKRGDAHQADLNDSDGSFKILGPEGRGIAPGKYRVAVTQRYSREAFEALKGKLKGMVRDDDLLQDKFGPMTSPIVREIYGSVDLVIDLDKPTEGIPSGG